MAKRVIEVLWVPFSLILRWWKEVHGVFLVQLESFNCSNPSVYFLRTVNSVKYSFCYCSEAFVKLLH